jgi:nucleotide-binding universal stress UspA family protein
LYQRIVVAFDASDGAHTALRKAGELARAFGATVTLVRCTGAFGGEAAGGGVDDVDPGAAAAARGSLEEAAAKLPAGVGCVLEVLAGSPPGAIVGFAEQSGADLIVTGSRGPALMPQAVLGRVTSAIVSGSPCDVLVVEPEPAP